MARYDSFYGDMSADGGFSLFDLLTGNADGYQTAPAVTESYAPAADYGMGVQTIPNVIQELLPYTEPVQSTPAVTTEQVPMDSVLPSVAYTDSGAPIATNPNMSEADFLASLTGQPAAAAPSATNRSDYYTALRDYVAGLSSPYGTYIPEVSALMRYMAGTPTGTAGSGAYDPNYFGPWGALSNPDAPIDPGLLDAMTSAINPNAPYEQNVSFQFNPFKDNKYGGTNPVTVLYNTPIRLTDAKGNVLMSGTGFKAAEDIAKAIDEAYASAPAGAKPEFSIDTAAPGDTSGTGYKTASLVSPIQNGLAQFVGTALPIVTSFIPGLNVLGKIAAMGAAGAGGAAIQGKDPLKAGLISAATAGLVNAPILPGGASIGSTLGNVLGAPATSAVKGGLDAAGNIVVVAPSTAAAQALAGFGQFGAGALAGDAVLGSNIADYQQAFNEQAGALPSAATPPAAELPAAVDTNQIVVAANKLQNAADLINAGSGAALLNLNLTPSQMQSALEYAAQTQNQTVVEGKKLPETPVTVDNIFSGISAPVVGGVDTATGEIVAEAPRKPPETLAPVYDFGFGQGGAGTTVQQPTLSQPGPTTLDTTQPKSLLDQILKYGSLASLASSALGDLFGGSGGAAGTTTPYTSVLGPAPVFGRGGFQPYTGDYETYATRPEWNFFTPATATPAAAPAAPTTQTYTPLI